MTASLLNPFALRRCVLHTRMSPSECDMRICHRAHAAGIGSQPIQGGFSMRKRRVFSHSGGARVVGRFTSTADGTRVDIVQRYTGITLLFEIAELMVALTFFSFALVSALLQLFGNGQAEFVLSVLVVGAAWCGMEWVIHWFDCRDYGMLIAFLKTNLDDDVVIEARRDGVA